MTLQATGHIEHLLERYPALKECQPAIEQTVQAIVQCHEGGGKVLICGNGGSAADAEHIVGELAKSFVLPRKLPSRQQEALRSIPGLLGNVLAERLQQGVRAFSLNGGSSLATAIVNDGDPDLVFAQMAYVYGQPGDVLLGISTSGNSKNIVTALTVGRTFGMTTIGMTGAKPAAIDSLCDAIIKVPALETFKIQEFHLPIYHAICLTVEAELFS